MFTVYAMYQKDASLEEASKWGYVGITTNLEKRLVCHKTLLKRQQHHSLLLQGYSNKVGYDNLKLFVVESGLSKHQASRLEYELRPYPGLGLNSATGGIHFGPTADDDTPENTTKKKVINKMGTSKTSIQKVNVYYITDHSNPILSNVTLREAATKLLPKDMKIDVFVRNLRNTFSQGARRDTRGYFIRKLDEEGNPQPTYREKTLGKH